MLRKFLSVMLCAVMFVTQTAIALAAVPEDMQGKLSAVEKAAYGGEQTGALLDRVNKLERDFEGKHPNQSIMERVNDLYNRMFDNQAGPSIITQLNAIEWTIGRKVSMEPVQKRVGDMETTLAGKQSDGTYLKRIDTLAGYAYGAKPIPLVQMGVPANTLAKVALVTPVNAKNIRVGDVIEYTAAEDIVSNGMLLFAKGAKGVGEVTKVIRAQNFGRDAKVVIDFKYLTAIDGTEVPMILGKESEEMMEHMAMAAGASIAGIVLLGPIGVIGGAFVKGKNVDLPAGTELFIQTRDDATLYGLETGAADSAVVAPAPEKPNAAIK